MFGNSIALTKNGSAWNTVSRIGDAGDNGSRYYYRAADADITFTIRHSNYTVNDKSNRKGMVVDRHNVELLFRQFGTGTTPDFVQKAYIVFENDRGDSLTAPQDVVGALQEFLTDANVLKLLTWES